MTAPRVERAAEFRRAARAHVEDVIQLASAIASIPAPTGDEQARARFVADWWKTESPPLLDSVEIDDLHNVVAILERGQGKPEIVLAAHLDTVFPADTPLELHRDADRLYGAGIGDNSLGTAALLMLPRLLQSMGVRPPASLVLAAPVGEEGLGNLRGMRAVMSRHPRAAAAIAIEGHNLGRVTATAVGSKRFRVTVTGPGGHSWGDYGRESAIHVLGRIISDLSAIEVPTAPKTTFNVGRIEGGISINTIAPSASMLIDLRSIDAGTLRDLVAQVERRIRGCLRPSVAIDIEVLGERPAGAVDEAAAVVEIAKESLRALGINPALDASSTDANIPISMGIPAICIGLTTGGNVHRPDEFIDVKPVADGFAQLALLTVQLADHLQGSAR